MVSHQINSSPALFQKLEANLERLRSRVPDLPLTSILLSRVIQHVGREMAAMLEHQIRPFGLAEAEFRVLMMLFSQSEGVANPTELCAKTGQSPANMSRICDALVGRDLITRVSSARDRRKLVLRITEQGDELVRRLLPTLFEPMAELFKDFTEAQQRTMIGQLKELGSRLFEMSSRQAAEPPP